MKKRILLTGGSGMVGRNILEHRLASKFEFLNPPHDELDLTNYNDTFEYVKKQRPDVIVHAAGRVGGIQANIESPVEFLVTNLDAGRNIVLAARNTNIRQLLNLGSSCMYPRSVKNPLCEEQILTGELEPTNEGYALAKIITARLCLYINQENSKYQYKTLIPCNLYGRHDKFSPEHSHLIPAIIHKIFQAKQMGESTVVIWGDGQSRREFMYAADLAEAIITAVDTFEELPKIMNLGTGADHTINEYYAITAKVIGWNGTFTHDLSKPVGMRQKLVSIDKQLKWGWSPLVGLTEGIKKSFEYYLQSTLNVAKK